MNKHDLCFDVFFSASLRSLRERVLVPENKDASRGAAEIAEKYKNNSMKKS